ncbi:unnamed protein product, partial [marine sediment metagenome]
SVVEAFHKVKTIYGTEMTGVTVLWPDGSNGSWYDSGGIHIEQDDRFDRDVILHEYGHYIQDTFNFQDGSVGSDTAHSWNQDLRFWAGNVPVNRSDEEARNLAFREAWPTFFSISVQFADTNDTAYDDDVTEGLHLDLESEIIWYTNMGPGEYDEGMNTCSLWDIFDNNNHIVDDNDTLALGHDEIWTLVRYDKDDDIVGFWNSWFGRYGKAREVTRVFLDHRMQFIAQTPENPTPNDNATDQSLSVDLNWDDASNATSYDVYFGTDSTPDSGEFKGNTVTSAWNLPTLNPNTMYFWQVISKDGQAEAEGPVWSFTTISAPPGFLQFKSATYTVDEDGGSIRIYVSRTDGSYGAASVNYATANGSATAGS